MFPLIRYRHLFAPSSMLWCSTVTFQRSRPLNIVALRYRRTVISPSTPIIGEVRDRDGTAFLHGVRSVHPQVALAGATTQAMRIVFSQGVNESGKSLQGKGKTLEV
jgi:hypothetical protein